ncbi:FtsX-like permease family protein [Fictibacillus sp. NRS-1165]|uniref:FtsX-like permease family protein n=1 Tax=Fictibacillus sp. NRS-1165 TaxID=3144463 RepID=UPI003D200338
MTFPQFAFRNVLRSKRTYAAYFLSSSFSVMIFFVYALFIFHPGIKKGLTQSLAIQLMVMAEFVMYFFAFFFVLYSVSTFLKTRKKEFGILMMHGMTKTQLNIMVFMENMMIGTGAILIGIAAGILTAKLFFLVAAQLLDIHSLPFYLSWKAVVLTIGAFLGLFLLISVFTAFLVRTNSLISLFQSGQKPKKEPKVSVLLSLLSAVLLLASYYLAATATMNSLMIRMVPVIVMTIVGSYFFFTQLSVFIMRSLQKKRFLFWKKTNIITISSLSYRLKDNARMFFMVCIVSTVAFCAVGSLSSMKTLSKQFDEDYAAEISYIARDQQPLHKENLNKINNALKQEKLKYTTYQTTLKILNVTSSDDKYAPKSMPVMSFSAYKAIRQKSGNDITEESLTGKQVLKMKTSSTETFAPHMYTFKQAKLSVNAAASTKHVAMPRELIDNEGLVVSDELYQQIKPASTQEFTGFFTPNMEETKGMLNGLAKDGIVRFYEKSPYSMTVSGTLADQMMKLYSALLFVALLIGAVFFVAAGSFLYFRLYADLEYDIRLYQTIKKVGLTDNELNGIVTKQIALLFFVPIAAAFVHSAFAFSALQSFFSLSIAGQVAVVLAGFLTAQLIYFFMIRHRYLRNLRKSLI